MIDHRDPEIAVEEVVQIFCILHPKGLVESVVGVEGAEDLFRDHPIADERIARDRMHEEKGPCHDTPEGEEEDQSFF